MAQIIDGKLISARIREEIAEKVKEYNAICPLYNMATPITEYKMTHADRIRAMSDEELADVVANGVGCVLKAPHCMEDDFCCTRVADKETCSFRKVFCTVSRKIKNELDSLRLSDF